MITSRLRTPAVRDIFATGDALARRIAFLAAPLRE
jgi:hypothetical protein